MIRERVKKSGKKSFLARATAPNGKFYRKTFASRKEAKAWLAEQKAKKMSGDYVNTPNKTTVTEYFDYYIKVIASRLEERSAWGYELDIKNHVLPLLGNKKLADITYDDGVLLQQSIQNKGLSEKTNNKVLSLFKQGLEFASSGKGERRELDRNPLKGFSFFKTRNKEIKYWESGQVMEFLKNAVSDHDRDLYALAINTGMRLGEIAALQVKKIDFGQRIITISNSLKRRKGGGFRLGPTKNKLTRYFPMNEIVIKIIRRATEGKTSEDFLFWDRSGSHVDVNHFCERRFRKLQEKFGVEKSICFHDLRHTYASNFVMSGGGLFVLQKMLGHKKVDATLVYAHLSPSYLQEAAELVKFDVVA